MYGELHYHVHLINVRYLPWADYFLAAAYLVFHTSTERRGTYYVPIIVSHERYCTKVVSGPYHTTYIVGYTLNFPSCEGHTLRRLHCCFATFSCALYTGFVWSCGAHLVFVLAQFLNS
jgi:hypothetical protein